MAGMSQEQITSFLAAPRIGIFTSLRADGAPVAVPVWFEWDGAAARVFCDAASGKVKRIERDPRVSLLVANNVGEPEQWVAFDGRASVDTEGAFDLAERLAHRYWDMTDAAKQASVESWRREAAGLRVITIAPAAVRTSTG